MSAYDAVTGPQDDRPLLVDGVAPAPPVAGAVAPAPAVGQADLPPGARLTVSAVARRLGVAPATLRTWDRRYGLGPSEHSAGSHRRYTGDDLVRLDAMRRLVLDGVTPAEAAQVALNRPRAMDEGQPRAARSVALDGVDDESPLAAEEDRPSAAPGPAGRPRRGGPGGHVLALPGADGVVRGIGRAAMALDAGAVTTQVRACLEQRGVLATWEEVLRPVLVAVGTRWAATGEGVEVEHLLSDCVAVALRERASAVGPVGEPGRGRPVLLACAPGELHALPLHALAAGLAERGVTVRTLGPATPAPALQAAVRRTGPAAVFVWSQLPGTADPAPLEALPLTRPPTAVVVGGPGWQADRLSSRISLAGDLPEALALVGRAVGG